MIGGSFQAVKAMREKTKVTEAKEQIKTVEDTLVRYALEFPNLPSIADFQNIVSPSIGNPKPLLYAPDAVLSLPSNDICAFSTTNLKVIDKDGVSIPNVAFVLAHGSINNKLETTFNTSTTPHQVVVSQPSSAYDDIVQWVTLSELQQSVDCFDKPLRIVNNSLPDTYTNLPYSATLVIDGNYAVPSFNNCTFSPSPKYDAFTYDSATYTISWSLPPPIPQGIVAVDCTFTADSKTVSKKFAITVSPASCGGSLPAGATCAANCECLSGICSSNVCQ
jgi:hypothetical protein